MAALAYSGVQIPGSVASDACFLIVSAIDAINVCADVGEPG